MYTVETAGIEEEFRDWREVERPDKFWKSPFSLLRGWQSGRETEASEEAAKQGEKNQGRAMPEGSSRTVRVLHSKRELRFLVHFRKMPLEICDNLLYISLGLQFPALRL